MSLLVRVVVEENACELTSHSDSGGGRKDGLTKLTKREDKMATSRRLAGLIGPTLIALSLSEAINLQLMFDNPASVVLVYLNGTLLFVAGVAIVRDHNRWMRGWPVLVTLIGWLAIVGGLGRMFAPVFAQRETHVPGAVYALLAVLLVVGIFLSFKAYGPDNGKSQI
jgi:uncharacterized membrane protein